jgi:hypothetical protein
LIARGEERTSEMQVRTTCRLIAWFVHHYWSHVTMEY